MLKYELFRYNIVVAAYPVFVYVVSSDISRHTLLFKYLTVLGAVTGLTLISGFWKGYDSVLSVSFAHPTLCIFLNDSLSELHSISLRFPKSTPRFMADFVGLSSACRPNFVLGKMSVPFFSVCHTSPLFQCPTVVRTIPVCGEAIHCFSCYSQRAGPEGRPEGKRPLGRPRPRWEDNIKIDLQEVGCGGVDLIELARNRYRWRALVNTVMNFGVPQNEGNFLSS